MSVLIFWPISRQGLAAGHSLGSVRITAKEAVLGCLGAWILVVSPVGCGAGPAPGTGGQDADVAPGDVEPGDAPVDAGPQDVGPDVPGDAAAAPDVAVDQLGGDLPMGDVLDDGAAAEAEMAAAREAYFALEGTHVVEIALSPGAMKALDEDPYSYVMGEVTVDGVELPSSGVRLKGMYGSFRTLDEKAAFLLNFGKFEKGQRYLGMRKLALNNMVQDPSMIHERLAYHLFRAGGVPAGRSGYTWVQVNGEHYGLYGSIEVVDNPHFLSQWFDDNDGNLYEGEYGVDLYWDSVAEFDQDAGKDVGMADLYGLVNALDWMEDPDAFMEEAGDWIDLDRFLTFAATEIYLGHWDGYAWTQNNYFLYRAQEGLWTWLPWGLDQVFWEHLYPFGGQGRIQQMCVESPACRIALGQRFEEVLARVEEIDLFGQTYVISDHIWAAVEGDPRKEVSADEVAWAMEATRDFLVERPGSLMAELICADPSLVDEDQDGHSGCGEDCDDGDPAVFPGAPELCNLKDDNCNGILDEGGDCPTCAPWDYGDLSYLFCWQVATWAQAREDCLDQGGDLASIHDIGTQNALRDQAFDLLDEEWWIGLNDLEDEGEFVWTDETPVNFEAWGGGEPNNAGNEDCVHLASWTGGTWNDMPCDFQAAFVCLVP